MPPIGIQLYTVRAQLAEDFEGVIHRIADIGYTGVEFGGNYGESPAAAKKLVTDLGMQISSMHAPTPMKDNLTLAIDTAGILGVNRVVCAWYPPEVWTTVESIQQTCQELNMFNDVLRGNNLELHYHNHWAECYRVGDKLVYQYMLEQLDPTVGLEIDTYWAKTAGADPVTMIREAGKRGALLHIKDGPANEIEANMTAVGDGILDWNAISRASQDTADWWIVELDRCGTDMLEAVEKSYHYITQRGYANGRK